MTLNSSTLLKLKRYGANTGTYLVAFLWFFPLLYMFLTAFKRETDVIPPSLLFQPTLENFAAVLSPKIVDHLSNSMIITLSTVALCLLFGVLAAYVLVFGRLKRPDNLFFWFLSTLFLPPVSVIVPIYLLFRTAGMLDTHAALIIMYTGIHVQIVIWMVRSFFKDLPSALLEAAYVDGCTRVRAFFSVILPLSRSGIISTGLLVFVFVWNEFFVALSLTKVDAAPVTVYMASFMTQEGLFWARLSAISTIVVIPPLILGWFSQKALVKGLTLGALKG